MIANLADLSLMVIGLHSTYDSVIQTVSQRFSSALHLVGKYNPQISMLQLGYRS